MTRIVIADDQALFREGLRTLLSTRPDMEVVGEASNGDDAVALVERLLPAVVLMDLPHAEGRWHPGDGTHPRTLAGDSGARPHHVR